VIGAAALLGNFSFRGARSKDDAISGALIGSIVAWTSLVMMPTIRLITSASVEDAAANPELYSALVSKWDKLHTVRTLLALVSFIFVTVRPFQGK
jgi:hypothetical protein